ncbi:hypothetical protein [Streptomyces sp. NBC_01750]|uniref:hypothetical protein n=1 Tax=Streptomyces sp. NBC_01750 TaxID=2975928 RepID=UPI003FA3B04F
MGSVDTAGTVGTGISTGPAAAGSMRQTSPHSESSEQHSERIGPDRTGQSAMSASSYAVSHTEQVWVAVMSWISASGPLTGFALAR